MLATRMKAAQPSATKAATAKAALLKERGVDVISLTQGEPDFATPANICAAAERAIREGRTRYTPVNGVKELREAIRHKFKADNGLDFAADEVTIGNGAKQLLFNAFLATLDSGDEVIIPAPCWVSYPEMVKLAGGSPRIVDCVGSNFKLTPELLEQAISPATKWLVLNSPSNPTGAVYTCEELAGLADVLGRYPHIQVISDEIYEHLVYSPARFCSFGEAAQELRERTLIVNGVSKASAMTGWRLGFGAGPKKLIDAINTIQGQSTSHPCSIAQYAAIEALAGPQDHLDRFRRQYAERRDAIVDALSNVELLDCARPDGAFYAFPDVSGLIGKRWNGKQIENDNDVCDFFLEAAGVGTVAGASFLASPFGRMSFARPVEELELACERIRTACALLV